MILLQDVKHVKQNATIVPTLLLVKPVNVSNIISLIQPTEVLVLNAQTNVKIVLIKILAKLLNVMMNITLMVLMVAKDVHHNVKHVILLHVQYVYLATFQMVMLVINVVPTVILVQKKANVLMIVLLKQLFTTMQPLKLVLLKLLVLLTNMMLPMFVQNVEINVYHVQLLTPVSFVWINMV